MVFLGEVSIWSRRLSKGLAHQYQSLRAEERDWKCTDLFHVFDKTSEFLPSDTTLLFLQFLSLNRVCPVGPMLRIGNSGEAHSSLLFHFSGFSGNWGCYRPTRFSFTQMASSGNFWFVIEGEAILQRICFYACFEALCLSCEFSNWVVYVMQLCFICAVIYIDFGVGFNTKFQHRLNHSMCVYTHESIIFL